MAQIGQSRCPVQARAWVWISVGLQVTEGEPPLLACDRDSGACGRLWTSGAGRPCGVQGRVGRGSGWWLWPGFSLGSRGAGRESGVPQGGPQSEEGAAKALYAACPCPCPAVWHSPWAGPPSFVPRLLWACFPAPTASRLVSSGGGSVLILWQLLLSSRFHFLFRPLSHPLFMNGCLGCRVSVWPRGQGSKESLGLWHDLLLWG